MSVRIYADNAATSFPKPPEVFDAMAHYAAHVGASAGRGAYHEAIEAGEILQDCRRRLASLINAPDPKQVIFTHNCSAALNLAIKGLLRKGNHVVATRMEHNSVLRPLHALMASDGVEVTFLSADSQTGLVDPSSVTQAIRPNTRLICFSHASNVSGTVQPVVPVAAEARRRGIPILVDAAQSAGHLPINVQTMQIDLLALPGHKGLLGPLGTGALYIRPGLEREIRPLIEGGTGSVSETPTQPEFMPDKFESGSHNAIGLAGLAAALQWIQDRGVADLRAHEESICKRFLDRISDVPGLILYGPREVERRVAVFSIRLSGFEPAELSAVLDTEFGVLTRSGIHCAPFAHETFGTHADGGTTRISFGHLTTLQHVDAVADGLAQLAAAAVPS